MKTETYFQLTRVDENQWRDFVLGHPQGTIFQSPEMFHLFNRSKNFRPVIVLATENDTISGCLHAVIIREFGGPFGFFSSRTVVYGGPLIDPENADHHAILRALLLELIRRVKNKSVFIQFRNFTDRKPDEPIFRDLGFNSLERLNYLVDTSAEETVRARMSSSKLRQVRKGLEAGAEIISPENEEQVRTFYEILHTLYRNKVKKPLPGYSFFHNFYQLSEDNGLGIIRLVRYEGKIIGGILCPVFRDKVIYEWYVCGLDQEYKQIYPSVLATWAAIDYALKNNIQTFDFMGVGVPGKDYGVREFKSKFGGELVNYGRFGRINNGFLYGITEIGYNILALMRKI